VYSLLDFYTAVANQYTVELGYFIFGIVWLIVQVQNLLSNAAKRRKKSDLVYNSTQ
jgi:hypothetical protein